MLRPEDLVTIHPGKATTGGTRVVIALGTGSVAAALVATRQGFRALPTEAGHMSFALAGEEESALGKLLETGDGRLSNEDVLSGRGIVRRIDQGLSQNQQPDAAPQTAEATTAAAISPAIRRRWIASGSCPMGRRVASSSRLTSMREAHTISQAASPGICCRC